MPELCTNIWFHDYQRELRKTKTRELRKTETRVTWAINNANNVFQTIIQLTVWIFTSSYIIVMYSIKNTDSLFSLYWIYIFFKYLICLWNLQLLLSMHTCSTYHSLQDYLNAHLASSYITRIFEYMLNLENENSDHSNVLHLSFHHHSRAYDEVGEKGFVTCLIHMMKGNSDQRSQLIMMLCEDSTINSMRRVRL